MENAAVSKEEVALELALKALETPKPSFNDFSPENLGKAVATLYNAILENLKL